MFRKNNTASFVSFLEGITAQQSRTLLLTGDAGWGKTSCALDIAQMILQSDPLSSSDFFYFRNDNFTLKTRFFTSKMPDSPEAWTWLRLLQRRVNIISAIEETLTTTVKLPAFKEQLDEHITRAVFPDNAKFIEQLIQISESLDKKSGIPINVIREAITFHSVKSSGRVSVLADFDTSEPNTQNAALKLIEEPNPNHWIVITAQNEKNLLPTILSRTLKIPVKKPMTGELNFLGGDDISSLDIFNEAVYNVSDSKLAILKEFFNTAPEKNAAFIEFSEKISKDGTTILFLDELVKCFTDSLRVRQAKIRNINIPLLYPQYSQYSELLKNAASSEIYELVQEIENTKKHISRSVIKDDYIMPKLLLDITRVIRKVN